MRRTLALLLLFIATVASAQELRRSGFLGVQIADDPASGVVVKALIDGGSAKSAGIRIGDVITGIDDEGIVRTAQFVVIAKGLHAGDVVPVRIRRGDRQMTIQVTVKPRPKEKARDIDVTYRVASSDGAPRRLIVTAPKTPARHPAVLMVNGIGCYSQESLDGSAPSVQLLYALTRAGFVTMRVEKSAMGDSEGPPCEVVNLTNELHGYLAGLRALKSYDFVDPQKVFILGISIGGVEAPMLATQEPVHGIVVVNTVAKPFLEYLLETRRRQALLKKVPYDEIDRTQRLEEVCNHRALIEKAAVGAECHDYVEYPASLAYMREWAAINPSEEWKAVEAPVLIVYGTADVVATQADHPYLAAMLNSFHPGSATLEAIDGMEHGLTTNETLNPRVVSVIESWLAEHS